MLHCLFLISCFKLNPLITVIGLPRVQLVCYLSFVMAPTEKDSYNLARNYGLDISMPDVNLAVSTAAQKVYAKKCNLLYKEFQKNLSALIKEEHVIRRDLSKLKREKAMNSRYSLYRSAGADLFSKASQKRKKLMDNNLVTISPLLQDCFDFTPWGEDSVVNEDETGQRPKTAPPEGALSADETDANTVAQRPQTAAIGLGIIQEVEQNVEIEQSVTSPEQKTAPEQSVALPEQKMAQIDRLIKSASQFKPSANDVEKDNSITDFNIKNESENEDGEVDVQTERTRARKITIKAEKFKQLENGKTFVKLKDKEGEFILKPLNINYEPDEVEAVFFAKDPTREKMALVRQKTNWSSNTVASDLKVNNRIAIQKSLMGKSSKKTTVAEIFNSARDRRTRHFRIMLKTPMVGQEKDADLRRKSLAAPIKVDRSKSISDPSKPKLPIQPEPGKSAIVQIYKHQKKMIAKQTDQSNIKTKKSQTTDSTHQTPARITKHHQKDDVKPVNTSQINTKSPPRLQITAASPAMDFNRSPNQKHFPKVTDEQVSNRVKFMSKLQERQTKLRRSSTSMSVHNREIARSTTSMGMNSQERPSRTLSDKDKTEMLRRLVEGDSESELSGTKKRKPGVPQRRRNTDSDNMSIVSGSVYYDSAKRILSSNDARQIIKDHKRRDQEYDTAMLSMRRRVAIGASGGSMRRPYSVASYR